MEKVDPKQLKRYKGFLSQWHIHGVLKKILPTLIVNFSPSIYLTVDDSGDSYTDGKHINLSLGHNFLRDRYSEKQWLFLMRALEGHECQHVNSTPIHFMADIQRWYGKYMENNYDISSGIGAKLGGTWLNIIEDGRIEQIAATHHPGLKVPLQYMNVESFRDAKLTRADLDGDSLALRNQTLCYAKLGYSISGFQDLAGSEMAKQFEKIKPLVEKGVNDLTCSDCYATTKEILTTLAPYFAKLLAASSALAKLLEQMEVSMSGTSGKESEQNDGNPQKGVRRQSKAKSKSGEGSDGKDGDGSDGDGEGDQDGQAGQKGKGSGKDGKDGDESSDGDGKDGKGAGKDSKGAGKDGKGAGEDGKDGKDSGKSKGKGKGRGKGSADDQATDAGEGKSDGSPARPSGRCMDHDTTTDPGTYGETIPELDATKLPYSEHELVDAIEKSVAGASSMITAKSKEPKKNGLTEKESEELKKLYEKNHDRACITFWELYSDATPAPLPAETMAKARILHRHLLQILRAKCQEVRNQYRGQLDVRALWKVGCGDKAVMMRRGRPITADCAVFELVDNSGSMAGNKFKLARLVGGALEIALHDLAALKISLFNTIINTQHYTIKDFDQTGPANASIAFGSIANEKITAGGGNKDGYSIRVATKELMKRAEKRKVLVVISDGEPTDYSGGTVEGMKDVKRAVCEARRQGIIVIALLIGSRRDIQEMRSRHVEMYGKSLISCEPEYMLSEFEKLFTQLIKQS